MIKKMKKKTSYHDAVLYTGENGAKIVELLGDYITDVGDNHGPDLMMHTIEGVMWLSPGEYLVSGGSYQYFEVYTAVELNAIFEEVK